jgi:starvation-inducible outer membrane lipoprotein
MRIILLPPKIMLMTKTKSLLFICIAFLLTSCTVTTTKTKEPVFNDIGKVENELVTLVKADNINLNGKEITVNKNTTTELEVAITNGANIPNDDNERKTLGKSIATRIKTNLKDPNEYDKYTVLFVTKVESGAVTKTNSVGDIFSSKEL